MRRAIAIAAAGAMALAGCASEDLPGGEGETLTVTAVDYDFPELPSEIAAGTALSIDNQSEDELHEVVAIRLPDDEERPIEELLALPPEEQAQFEQGVQTVVLQPPGADQVITAVPGTLEAGRYLFACFIPQGIDPQEYLEAAQAAEGGPPQVEGGGPPHVALGMWAEVTVS